MSASDTFPSHGFFEAVYRGRAPWDIGAPQPDLMALIEEFPPKGRILDLGCGTGDLAIGLARTGRSVLGIDFVDSAIEEAKKRAATLPSEQQSLLEFRVGDALGVSAFATKFDHVTDSGFYHLFEEPVRRKLARELAEAMRPGGRFYMIEFGIVLPAPDMPKHITVDEVQDVFNESDGWVVRAAQQAAFRTIGFDDIPALAMCAERIDSAGAAS